MSIDADTLRQPLKLRRERVELSEFGDGQYAWMHAMSQREATRLQAANLDKDGTTDLNRAKLHKVRQVCHCLRDDEGNRILGPQDYEVVQDWPAGLVDRLFDVSEKLSESNGQDLEELAKN